jgi:hypothetical protein
MATIKLEVTIEDLENSQLDDIDEKVLRHLKAAPSSVFPGTVVEVAETDRDEDEEEIED